MKKVLIITYYWPPSGGVGAQRWLKFAKYLKEFNWEPVIFTPENPDFDIKDESGLKDISDDLEVLKLPIWEPYQLFRTLKGEKKNVKIKQGLVLESNKKTLFDKISIWIRGNVILPDPRRFWVRPAISFLSGVIERNNIDVVVTTGPPHSIHLIGLGLRKKHNIKWMADFRDPWSRWDLLDKLKTSSLARRMHSKWEKRVLTTADYTLLTSKRQEELFCQLGAKNAGHITNGFDPDDFQEIGAIKSSKFVISHIGLLNEMRNPIALFEVLEELCEENDKFSSDLELRLGGIVSDSIIEAIRQSNLLNYKTTFLDYIPHNKIFMEYERASVLLLILNNTDNSNWILPAKLFEYIYTRKPILMLGEIESDSADITRSFSSNEVVGFNDKTVLKEALSKFYRKFEIGQLENNTGDIDKYSRKKLTSQLANVFDDMIASN